MKLRKITKNAIMMLITLSIIVASITGCVGVLKVNNNKTPSKKAMQKYSKSFVKIKYYLKSKKTDKMHPLWVGSGAYVTPYLTKNKSNKVLTAAHVCKMSNRIKRMLLVRKGVNVKNYNPVVIVDSYKGKDRKAKVLKIDVKNDICLMKTKVKNHSLGISRLAPKYGEEVYSIAAPSGIYKDKMNLIFNGFFSGKGKIGNVMRNFYTIPSAGGSSGSPIINSRGRVVGIISMGTRQFENVSISPEYKELAKFLY